MHRMRSVPYALYLCSERARVLVVAVLEAVVQRWPC